MMKYFNLSYTTLDESRRLIECGVVSEKKKRGSFGLGELVMILSEKCAEFGYTFSMDEKTVRIMEKTKNGISSNYFIGGILIESVVSAIVWLYNKKRK